MGDKKSYFLFAKDQDEMDRWMRAISVEHAMCAQITSASAKGSTGKKTGYLQKSKYKAGGNVGRQKRWMSLSGCLLQWWEDEAEFKAGKQCKGSMDLSLCTFMQHGEISKMYCYEVISSKKSIFLWAESATEMQDWIEAVNHQVSLGRGQAQTQITIGAGD
jgi:hypothetical protein